MQTPIRVILADDHEAIRRGVCHILQTTPDIRVIGEAENGLAALREVQRDQAEVLLLDIQMPDMSGLEVAHCLREDHNPIHILILSGYSNPEFIDSALEIGVDGYLLKDEAPECLIEAVRRIASGDKGLFSEKLSLDRSHARRFHRLPCGVR